MMHTQPAGGFAPAARRRDPLRLVGVVVMAVVLVVSGGVIAANASGGDSLFPAKWDPRIAPIAKQVEKLRGLKFKHPVDVKFLSVKEFEQEVGVDESQLTDEDRADMKQQERMLRAIGWIDSDTDLLKAIDTSQKSGVLAFYDPDRKEVFVRGSKLDAQRRVTLAHELTHVLQDQHFDLNELQEKAAESRTSDSSVLRGLIEGDANRIEDLYLEKLPAKDKAEHERLIAAEGKRVESESGDVPEIVEFVFGAPYAFGPPNATVLAEAGGNAAINDALTGPVPTSRMFIQPGFVSKGVEVEEPQIPAGATPVGEDAAMGAFDVYLLLASQIDAVQALSAADGIAGGRQTIFEKGKQVCTRVELAADSRDAATVARRALREWAKARPKEASVKVFDQELGFEACDPGK
ncbi:MAG TPA: hypothetical protein VNC41_17920, partial [Acidimicrobiia bacterium]|nr:hypothetical protein [Acidimicrobiia bacterium]